MAKQNPEEEALNLVRTLKAERDTLAQAIVKAESAHRALAESHAELVATLERALPTLKDAAAKHPRRIDRVQQAQAALTKARALVPEAGA